MIPNGNNFAGTISSAMVLGGSGATPGTFALVALPASEAFPGAGSCTISALITDLDAFGNATVSGTAVADFVGPIQSVAFAGQTVTWSDATTGTIATALLDGVVS